MSVSPDHLFVLGEQLLNASPESATPEDAEVLRRSAVSRLYYAAYHLGLDYAQSQGFSISKNAGGTHQQLWSWYSRQNLETISGLGHKLRGIRNQADYKLRTAFPEDLAQTSLEQAAWLVDEIRQREAA
jgi:uncharacterized protein (UPF0332 family)